jgi:hypothetical protein
MAAKIVVAALVGALSGMLAATHGMLSPPSPDTETRYGVWTVARIETAWSALRRHGAP